MTVQIDVNKVLNLQRKVTKALNIRMQIEGGISEILPKNALNSHVMVSKRYIA